MTDAATASVAEADLPLCQSPEDFHHPRARQMAARLLAPFLSGNHATVTELLHSPILQKHVEGDRSWSGALQRVADLQAGRTGGKASTRLGELSALASRLHKDTRARLQAHDPGSARPGGLMALVATAARTGGSAEGAAFLVNAALTQALMGAHNWADKTERLLAFWDAESDSLSDGAKAHLDRLLGEILSTPGALHDICDRAEPVNLVIEDALVLLGLLPPAEALLEPEVLEGRPVPARERAPLVLRLAPVLADPAMTEARAGVVTALQEDLSGKERMLPAQGRDLYGVNQLLPELQLIGRLAQMLKPDGHAFLGGHATAEAIERRVGRLVSTGSLQDMLEGRTVLEKVETLFDLQKVVFGVYARRIVEDYLRTFLEDRDFAGRLLDSSKTRLKKLKSVAEVQQRVTGSLFPAEDRLRWASMLDQIQLTFIRTNQIFAPFETAAPPPQKVLEALDLTVEGAFTQGECVKRARQLLTRYAQRPTVIREFLAGTKDSAEGARRLALLGEKMRAAGVPFVDVTRMRVLMVEDEEAAAGYIRMVLADMGVTQITHAVDGHAALEHFAGHEDDFDLIICDWMMPRMSGIDFLKQVRSVRAALPFLMVTALATQPAVKEAMAHDVTAYIAKPFPPEQLEEKVMVLMNRGHKAREGKKPG